MVLGPHGLTMVPTDTPPHRTYTEMLSLQCIAHYVYNRLSLRGAASSGPGASARIACDVLECNVPCVVWVFLCSRLWCLKDLRSGSDPDIEGGARTPQRTPVAHIRFCSASDVNQVT